MVSSLSYQQLEVWRRAMDLAVDAYKLSESFPQSELFGIVSQMRRASCSVAFNIAEGWGRNNSKEFCHFLRIAHGSLREFETQLLLSVRLDFCKQEQINAILENITVISKQIQALSLHLKQKSIKSTENKSHQD